MGGGVFLPEVWCRGYGAMGGAMGTNIDGLVSSRTGRSLVNLFSGVDENGVSDFYVLNVSHLSSGMYYPDDTALSSVAIILIAQCYSEVLAANEQMNR